MPRLAPHPSFPKKADSAVITAGKFRVEIMHPAKPFWPKDGLTKRDLVDYYRLVAPVLLPYLKGRPESLNRHPDGIAGKNFFQKNVAGIHLPPYFHTAPVRSESAGKTLVAPVCDNLAMLLHMVNLGCIEINPWNSRLSSLDFPDYLVIDLDPEGVPFEKTVEAALAVRRVLDEAEVPSYCKTSGGRGLHVYVPLGAKYDFHQARQFAELIAALTAERLGGLMSLERNPSRRRHHVYFDFLQNKHGATTVAPYSARPRPGAPVSAPLEWREVRRGLNPAAFTITSMPRRIEKIGDPFAPVLGKGVNMAAALARLGR